MQPIQNDQFSSRLSDSRRSDVQPGEGIRVSGNTISWPSDGWHEVQYASSFNTASEGGQSASVGPGIYNVINHSTGERFDNIVVGQDAGGSSFSQAVLRNSSPLDMLRDSPSTTDRLSGSNSSNWGAGGIKDIGTESSTTTTVTPESNWTEVAGDAARDGAVAGYLAVRAGANPLLTTELVISAVVLSVSNNVEMETTPNSSEHTVPPGTGLGRDGAVPANPAAEPATSDPECGSGTTDSRTGASETTGGSCEVSGTTGGSTAGSGTTDSNSERGETTGGSTGGGSGTTDSNCETSSGSDTGECSF